MVPEWIRLSECRRNDRTLGVQMPRTRDITGTCCGIVEDRRPADRPIIATVGKQPVNDAIRPTTTAENSPGFPPPALLARDVKIGVKMLVR